ncbi:MAG: ABC transporter substrate-binding protein [Thermaerobacter sp.]|nr:ABC transporter substrate-binding protein [Thermaerobacter sp.]
MQRKASLLLALLLLVPAGAAHAAAGLSRPFAQTRTIPPTITVGVVGQPASLDPFFYTAQSSADILAATSDGLLRYAPTNWPANDRHFTWRPDLVSQMPRIRVQGPPGPDAAVTITYRLRSGLRWSDGARLTSKDVRFTWQAVMRPGSGAYQAGYDQITAIDTPNPLTAVVHLRGTYAAWQTLFSALLPYHALHARVGSIAQDTAYNLRPLATGPYVVVYNKHRRVVLRSNPYYAGQDGPAAKVARIVIRFYRDEAVLGKALLSHQVSVADNLHLSPKSLRTLRRAGMQVKSVPGLGYEQFTFNLFDPTAGDLSVRRAFYLALNRQKISRTLSGGLWTIATADQAPFSWAYNPKVPVLRQNIAKARRLLVKDGWQIGPGGYFQKAGQELTLRVSLSFTPAHAALMQAVRHDEAQAGIRVLPSYYRVAALFGPSGALARGQYQVAEFTLVDSVDPNDAALWNSDIGNRFTQGDDFSGYDNAAVNAWTQDALARMHTAPRARDYRLVQFALYRDLPMVPLFFDSVETAYNPKLVSHITVDDMGGSLWTANRWRMR